MFSKDEIDLVRALLKVLDKAQFKINAVEAIMLTRGLGALKSIVEKIENDLKNKAEKSKKK